MRKIASQVPSAVSRLLQSSPTQSPPVWYHPVLTNPPPILPPRQSVSRPFLTRDDSTSRSSTFTDLPKPHDNAMREGNTRTHKMKHLRGGRIRILPIVYEEDQIRRQFFKDFPFEALRPVSLVEGVHVKEEESFSGREWTELAQRGLYPAVEDCIDFTMVLHKHHNLSLSSAYAESTSQFIKLRAAHEMATIAAESEARHHGASFKRDPFDRAFDLENRALNTSSTGQVIDTTTSKSTKHRIPRTWSSSVPPAALPSDITSSEGFSGGRRYVEKWRVPPPLPLESFGEGGSGLGALGGEKSGDGDLLSLLNGEGAGEEEMDDFELLNATLSKGGARS